jgi:Arylsulfotransferase (ASST)
MPQLVARPFGSAGRFSEHALLTYNTFQDTTEMMRSTLKRVTLAFAPLTLVFAGCSSTPAANQPAPGEIEAVEHAGNVLAYDVSWTTSRSIGTELDVECTGLDPWTVSDSVATKSHKVFLMGLVAGASCTLTGKDSEGSATTTINVDDLPSFLPSISLSLPAAAGTIAPGWTLVNLSDEQEDTPYTVALVDPEGRYRWYYRYPTSNDGSDGPVMQYADGILLGPGDGVPMAYVTWQGKVVWVGPLGNHESREAETPDEFYFITDAPCSNLTNPGDTVAEYDPAENTNVWQWNTCDHYTPPEDIPDWSHLNTVSLFVDHKHLLVSARNQNELFKVDRATGDIVWKMGWGGEPTLNQPFAGDFTIAPADRFYHQHDATVLPNGHILMFDNGEDGVRNYSRALEIAYTYNPAGTSDAHMVWQFRHSPDVFSDVWGSAQRFENGNTLVDFGERTQGVHTTVVEVSSASKPLWEFQLPDLWGIYRAERIPVQQGFVVH